MMKQVLTVFLIFIMVIASIFIIYGFLVNDAQKKEMPDVFVGIDVAYDDLEAIKNLVDETSSYTNTFVIGTTGITSNVTKLNEIGQYIYDKELYFIIYFEMPPPIEVLKDYKTRWGDRLLGFYAHDEIGIDAAKKIGQQQHRDNRQAGRVFRAH